MPDNTLTEGDGYLVLDNIIPYDLLDSFSTKLDNLYPVRASSNDKKYAEKHDIDNLNSIAVWWSQLVMNWPEVEEMNSILHKHINKYIPNSIWYASDTVFIEPHSKWTNPHIDTPHRFDKWNQDTRLLGIQCIAPLCDLDINNGATGLVPGSQKKNFYIDLCYKGYYDGYYSRNYIQPIIKKGSVLIYNCRLLHSSMPNPTDIRRPAILFNYLSNDIINQVREVDNIWGSNG